jgi:molybdopterin synthase catalytic subunit
MTVEILAEPFNPWEKIQTYQDEVLGQQGKYGATSVFVGTMRDFNEGDNVNAMHLEHYPGMTEKKIEQIIQLANEQWDLIDCYVVHRVGNVFPNDILVLVVCWSAHRVDSFESSRFVMEKLKHEAPFWKKEVLADRTRWVEKNTEGYRQS